jgi:hypothetical protein
MTHKFIAGAVIAGLSLAGPAFAESLTEKTGREPFDGRLRQRGRHRRDV